MFYSARRKLLTRWTTGAVHFGLRRIAESVFGGALGEPHLLSARALIFFIACDNETAVEMSDYVRSPGFSLLNASCLQTTENPRQFRCHSILPLNFRKQRPARRYFANFSGNLSPTSSVKKSGIFPLLANHKDCRLYAASLGALGNSTYLRLVLSNSQFATPSFPNRLNFKHADGLGMTDVQSHAFADEEFEFRG